MEADAQAGEVVKAEDVEAGRGQVPAETQDRSQLPGGMLEPVADPGELVEGRAKRSKLIAEALEEGRDYGAVDGIPKPFLHKPGAERLTDAFGCYPRFTVEDQEIDHDREVEWNKQNGKSGESVGLYRYRVSCDLVHRASGIVVGNGLGACSTMEDKYVESPRNAENTALKMAKKRAHVDAALSTFGLSEMFTQDPDYVDSQQDSGPWSPDDTVGFGKHGDKTWREVVEEDPDYADWLQGADRTPDEAAEWIAEQLNGGGEDGEDNGERRSELVGEVWRELGRWITSEDVRETYLQAYAKDRDGVPDNPKEWTVKHLEGVLDHLREEEMAAVAHLEPED